MTSRRQFLGGVVAAGASLPGISFANPAKKEDIYLIIDCSNNKTICLTSNITQARQALSDYFKESYNRWLSHRKLPPKFISDYQYLLKPAETCSSRLRLLFKLFREYWHNDAVRCGLSFIQPSIEIWNNGKLQGSYADNIIHADNVNYINF